MKRIPCWPSVLAGLCCLAVAGCSRGSSQTVWGTVTLDGRPLADAEVVFESLDRSQQVGGDTVRTDAEGKFEVRPDRRKAGLKPGKFGVYVGKWVDRTTKRPPPAEKAEMLKASRVLLNIVPVRYSSREEAPVVIVEIRPGKNDVKIELTSK